MILNILVSSHVKFSKASKSLHKNAKKGLGQYLRKKIKTKLKEI